MKRMSVCAFVLVTALGFASVGWSAGSAPVTVINTETNPVPVTNLSQLGPKQPSDSIVLYPFGDVVCHGTGHTVNRQVLPDGTQTEFSIPEGWALVVTGIDYGANSVDTGKRTGAVVSTTNSAIVLAEGYTVNEGLPGSTSGTILLSTPMFVTSNLCIRPGLNQETHASRVLIRGFLVENP